VLLRASKLKAWLQAVRVFSFPATLIPLFVGAAMSAEQPGPVAWRLFPAALLSALLLHAATNVIGEYFDFKKGVDRSDTLGSSRVLVDRLLTPKEALHEGYLLFAAAFLTGLVLVANRGLPMLIFGAAGILGGYFYSAPPIGYKYRGLGDPGVFLLMGPLMVAGTYVALTGSCNLKVIMASVPVGCLASAILCANNLRDIKSDRAADSVTLEGSLGFARAKWVYIILTGSAYVSVAWMALAGWLPALSLLVFLSLPAFIGNLSTLASARSGNPEKIAVLDIQTAKLHLLFGIILGFSLIISRALK
jgi:1,4-dihydroxy-2-naphthoate polyprenyltransferase